MELIREINDNYKISNGKNCLKYLHEFKTQDREFLVVLGLDSANKILYREIVTIGTLNSSLIHPREIFKKAIIQSANSIIVAHNHPSGDLGASSEDLTAMEMLKKAGELLSIKVLDFLIVGNCEEELRSYI